MTFHKALKLLYKKKCKSIKNKKHSCFQQSHESIMFWLCEMPDEDTRKKNYMDWVFSDEWEIDEP